MTKRGRHFSYFRLRRTFELPELLDRQRVARVHSSHFAPSYVRCLGLLSRSIWGSTPQQPRQLSSNFASRWLKCHGCHPENSWPIPSPMASGVYLRYCSWCFLLNCTSSYLTNNSLHTHTHTHTHKVYATKAPARDACGQAGGLMKNTTSNFRFRESTPKEIHLQGGLIRSLARLRCQHGDGAGIRNSGQQHATKSPW